MAKLEERILEKDLVGIKKHFHKVYEDLHLGVADKSLINSIIDRIYTENSNCRLSKESFLTRVEAELSSHYGFPRKKYKY